MAELGSTNIHGDLNTTGDNNTGGVLSEKNQRVFSPNNRNISSSVASASSTVYASSAAAKAAYDKAANAVRKTGDTMTGKLTINGNAGLEVRAPSDWSYMILRSGSSESHLARNDKAVEGVAAGSLHLRPTGNYQGSLMLQPNSHMRHKTTNGYVDIGSLNAGHAHFQTDRPDFHFNKPVAVQGEIYAGASYNKRVYHTGYKPTKADVGLSSVPNWSSATFDGRYLGKTAKSYDSTRLGGQFNSTGAGANTIAQRDSAADLHARLFRSNYSNESRVTGAMAFRVSTSDNYIRFCSNPAAIRDWLGVTAPTAWTLLRSGSQAGNYISPVSLAGKEVCFVSTDRGGTNETAVTKVFIPAMSGFSNDTNCYIPNGHKTIEYDYYTREIRTYGDFGNRQIWYRTPPVNEYPAIGTLRP